MKNKSLQDKVEAFLSQAEVVLFQSVDDKIIMGLHFQKERFDIFSNKSNYVDFNNYFDGRKITLKIIQQPTYYRGSLIDTETGDTINLNNVNFVTDNLDNFVNRVPNEIEMPFFIYGYKKEGNEIAKLVQPILPNSKPLIVYGYSYHYNQ